MNHKNTNKQLIPLLRESINSYIANPIILLPFVTIAFIQMLILEILYFAPQFPLVTFFGPLIQKLEGEVFLHYPQNLIILPKWFQTAQFFIYIFISSFLIGVAIAIIANINNNKKSSFGMAARQTLSQYVHLVLAAIMTFAVFYFFSSVYSMIIRRALQIQSKTGIFYIMKATVIYGAPYFNLLIGVLVTAIFAFLFPIIIIEKKKIFSALILNFKSLWKSFWFLFFVVLIPTLFYVPVILLRNNLGAVIHLTFEGMRMIVLILSTLVMLFIDATVYTAITTLYLLKKENS
jgi:hypothetical protein